MTKYVSELSEKQKEELTNIFGKRVNFKKRERHYYTHDVGTLPYLVKPLLGKVEPAAIVRVSNEDEAVKLIKFANKYAIPIVPRAGAVTIGKDGESLFGAPVEAGKSGLLVFVGVNAIAAVEETGIEVTTYPVSTVLEYSTMSEI